MSKTQESQTAVRIASLSRKRGRPKTARPMHDSGTAELVMKRLKGETTEALDLCLNRNLITQEQHWCGVHLRWLYTLRFGVPGIRAIDPTHLGGADIKTHDTLWASSREEEYQSALAHLSRGGHAALVMNICIFNERPAFLIPSAAHKHKTENDRLLDRFIEGLDILRMLWCGSVPKKIRPAER